MTINYQTKFAIGEKVEIINGLKKGEIGVIKDYSPRPILGLHKDSENCGRSYRTCGVYTISQGFFSFNILAYECDLRRVPNT